MDYIILLFSCIAEYLIFSDFFDAFLSIRPNFQPIWNRILIAILSSAFILLSTHCRFRI